MLLALQSYSAIFLTAAETLAFTGAYHRLLAFIIFIETITHLVYQKGALAYLSLTRHPYLKAWNRPVLDHVS